MEKYRYSDAELKLIENSCIALAVYQFIDNRVVTIALSQGFLDLFDLPDRAEAYDLMDNNMYRDAHPDDVARIADAALRFATEGGEFNCIYRSKVHGEYRVFRSRGKHTYTDSGVRLAVITYSDEGSAEEIGEDFEKSVQNEFQNSVSNLKGHFDPITGLPGLNYFFELAEAGRKSIQARGGTAVALYFDFCGMREFNLHYGFVEGDRLIVAMSKTLVRIFSHENCCRIGGDRFAAYDEAEGLEDKLNQLLEESKTMNEGKTLPLRIGIYKGRDTEVGIGVACDRAKMACDEMRRDLSSGFHYFSDELLKKAELHKYIVENIDRAIRENWIQVYYQPIIRAANNRVCDEEALARWIDPVMGFLSPGDFIPVLEEAGLIYKLDLFVLEQILKKMKEIVEFGQYLVPGSVNISRSDFESCDIVEEIRKRVDASGMGRDMLTIEITESVVGNDLEYIKKQVERFHELGFKVWMDDYGSGYSSPDILQTIPFDTIKLDMQFIRQYEQNKTSGIIISSLVKMAMNLGIETVVEGVETEAQVEFLKEIGCTKLQGFYYCKPIPLSEVKRRYEEGVQIGFENPEETEYYAAIGKVNLYDLSLAVNEEQELQNYFNTMPMAILELDEKEFVITRCNQSYRNYLREHLNVPDGNSRAVIMDLMNTFAKPFIKKTLQCAKDGKQVLMDDRTPGGMISHILIRRIAVNPVTHKTALVLIVLGLTEERLADNLTYAHVAQALSADYIDLYYVDLDNDHYIEYYPDPQSEDMAVEERGKNFFGTARRDALKFLYEEDRERFVSNFTKENVVRSIQESGAFTTTYRLDKPEGPVYVHMKAIHIGSAGNHIIIGVSNVDAQMKQQETLERLQEENIAYSRMTALAGDYLFFYTVDPETGNYYEYSAAKKAESLGAAKEGDDFFIDTIIRGDKVIYPEDKEMFHENFNRQIVMEKVKNNEIYSLTYRLLIDGEPRYVNLRAAMVMEKGAEKLIFGLNDVDDQVKRDQEYAHNLSAARNRANIDSQTGVKNEQAFEDMKEQLDHLIKTQSAPPFSVAFIDEDLSEKDGVSDEERIALIRQGCMVICKIYRHSPVYRLGETEFAVISRGDDYEQIDALMEKLEASNLEEQNKDTPLSARMAKYQGEDSIDALIGKVKP